jgi:signal peptidase I
MRYETPDNFEVKTPEGMICAHPANAPLSAEYFVHYTGESMYPTFRDPEFLIVKKVTISELRPGDVIVFKADYSSTLIVHRIISLCKEGFTTQGDNNRTPDLKPVKFDDILGKAVNALRKRTIRPVLNGKRGLLRLRITHGFSFLRRKIAKPLFRNSFSAKIKIAFQFKQLINPKYVRFKEKDGTCCIHIIWKGFLIGRYRFKSDSVTINRPFRLLIASSAIKERLLQLKDQISELRE